jgi:hypothetical protein
MMEKLKSLEGVKLYDVANYSIIVTKGNSEAVKNLLHEYHFVEYYDYDILNDDEIAIFF